MELETVTVVHLNDRTKQMIINKDDYNPRIHTLWEVHVKRAIKEQEAEEKKRIAKAKKKAAEKKAKAEEKKAKAEEKKAKVEEKKSWGSTD